MQLPRLQDRPQPHQLTCHAILAAVARPSASPTGRPRGCCRVAALASVAVAGRGFALSRGVAGEGRVLTGPHGAVPGGGLAVAGAVANNACAGICVHAGGGRCAYDETVAWTEANAGFLLRKEGDWLQLCWQNRRPIQFSNNSMPPLPPTGTHKGTPSSTTLCLPMHHPPHLCSRFCRPGRSRHHHRAPPQGRPGRCTARCCPCCPGRSRRCRVWYRALQQQYAGRVLLA